jgi:hypothetical protein
MLTLSSEANVPDHESFIMRTIQPFPEEEVNVTGVPYEPFRPGDGEAVLTNIFIRGLNTTLASSFNALTTPMPQDLKILPGEGYKESYLPI